MTHSHVLEEYRLAYRVFVVNQWCDYADIDIINMLKQFIIKTRRKILRAPYAEFINNHLYFYNNHYKLNYNDVLFYCDHTLIHLDLFDRTAIYYKNDSIDRIGYFYYGHFDNGLPTFGCVWCTDGQRWVLSDDQQTHFYESFRGHEWDHRYYFMPMIFIESQ